MCSPTTSTVTSLVYQQSIYFFGTSSTFFALNAGDASVVVNFGTYYGSTPRLLTSPSSPRRCSAPVAATVINSRYIGTPGGDRLDWNNWTGGWTHFATLLAFEPVNGISLITHDLDQSNAQVQIGTVANPALLYVTRDIDDVQGELWVTGSAIVLRDWVSQGGPMLSYDEGFLWRLTPDLQSAFRAACWFADEWIPVAPTTWGQLKQRFGR